MQVFLFTLSNYWDIFPNTAVVEFACFKQPSACILIFSLCCCNNTTFWCDYITWISSTLPKWNRLYLENSTVNWTIDSIQFSTLWFILFELVRFNSFYCIIIRNKTIHFQLGFIDYSWWWFLYFTHAGKSILWWFPATKPNIFKQPTLCSFPIWFSLHWDWI